MTLEPALIDARFAAVLDPEEASVPPVLGIEHEYMVYRDGSPLDFRDLIHTLDLRGSLLHPTDEHRYLTPEGLALMADGIVAEVASPPEALRPGVMARLDEWGAFGHQQFSAALPPGTRLKGMSTHISVECPPGIEDEVAWQYSYLFAPALMLLLDDADSPGLLVRPRPSRIELGGEYAVGPRLRAATAFAAGSVLALIEAVRDGTELPLLPLELEVEPARRRFGFYVDRRAAGPDLYSEGRSSLLRQSDGHTLTAQEHLERTWRVARDAIAERLAHEDLVAADRVVGKASPLPSEVPIDRRAAAASDAPPPHEVGNATRERVRGDLQVRPLAVTWDFAAFEVSDGRRQLVSTVPRRVLARFLSLLDRGQIDRLLHEALQTPMTDRVLASETQTQSARLFGTILLTSALLPRDRAGVGDGTFANYAIGKLPLSVLMPQTTQTLIARATAAHASATAASAAAAAAAAPAPATLDLSGVQPGRSSIPGVDDGAIPGEEVLRGAAERHGRTSIPGDDDGPIIGSGQEEPRRRRFVPAAIAILVITIVLGGGFVIFRSGDDQIAPTDDDTASTAGGGATAIAGQSGGSSAADPTGASGDAVDPAPTENPLEDLVALSDFERIAQFFALHGSPTQVAIAQTYEARRPNTSAPPVEWVDGVSAFFFFDSNNEVWVQIDAPREFATNLCSEVDVITGRNQHVGDGIDYCSESATVPWYFSNVVTFEVGETSSRVTIVIRTGQTLVESNDRVAIWIFNAASADDYEGAEYVGQAAFAAPIDTSALDEIEVGLGFVGVGPSTTE